MNSYRCVFKGRFFFYPRKVIWAGFGTKWRHGDLKALASFPDNDIRDDGAVAMAAALRLNTALVQLHLTGARHPVNAVHCIVRRCKHMKHVSKYRN